MFHLKVELLGNYYLNFRNLKGNINFHYYDSAHNSIKGKRLDFSTLVSEALLSQVITAALIHFPLKIYEELCVDY